MIENKVHWLQTICSKSFTDINFDLDSRSVKYCCKSAKIPFPKNITADFFDKNSIVERRKDLFNGIKNSQCSHCWHDNKQNKNSYRDLHNQWKDEETTPSPFTDNSYIQSIEIKLDKTCDMSCVYCSGRDSSKIYLEENPTGKYLDNSTEEDIVAVLEWIKNIFNTLEKNPRGIDILFMGGEPTLSKKFPRFVKELSNSIPVGYEKYVEFAIVTNGNSTEAIMEKTLELIGSTKSLWNIGISNESLDKNAIRSRWGLDIERFQNNVKKYLTNDNVKTINLAVTVNMLTFNNLYEYIQWFFDTYNEVNCSKPVSMSGNFVSWPSVIDVSNLSKDNLRYCDELDRLCRENFKGTFLDQSLKFISFIRDRIGSTYEKNHQGAVIEFLIEKALQKKAPEIVRLIDNLNNSIKW